MALTKVSLVDLNAGELILDLDADTSITADTDDTVHIKIGGSDEITITGTALSPSTSDGNALGTSALEWSDLFLADGAVINFGDDQDVSLTHVADTGLLLSSTDQLQFGDSGTYIHQSADGVLDLVSDTEIEINATTIDMNGALDVSGTITSGGVITGTAFTAGSAVITEAELETLDGVTVGTAIASKVVTTDANIDTTGQRNLTISGELDAATGDFSGDVDIDGTANLDTVDIDGATQIDATVTVGVDDTGYDVKFFGATSGAHLLWDESVDDLILAGAARVVVPEGNLVLGSTAVTSTAAELNLLDGVSGLVQADLTKLAAVDSTAAELNLLNGVSGLVQADLTKLAAIDATATEINFIDGGATVGTTAVADGDGIIHNDGGTMKVTTAATFKTYFQEGISTAYDDLTAGDAAVLITTSSGNITIDAAANDSDIILKGTDGGADTTFLTIDGSAAGEATFNAGIVIADAGNIGSASDKDAIAIASDGVVTMNQIPVLSAGLNVSGGTIAGTIATATQNSITTATGLTTVGAANTLTTVAGIPFYQGDSGSIYTHDVSGTDDTATSNTAFGITAMDAITTGDSNSALGFGALGANTTGAENTAVGYQSMLTNTTGADNTAIGLKTLTLNTTGGSNTAVGLQALQNNTTGDGNIAVGRNAMQANTTGTRNTAIGYTAYDASDTENDNLAIGYEAMSANTAGGTLNVAIGNYTLDALTSGDGNVGVGYQVLSALTTGGTNTAIGHQAMMESTTGDGNTAVGNHALENNSTGGSNVAVGRYALESNTTADDNVAVGYRAAYENTTGTRNVAVGTQALDAVTTANSNTAIGHKALLLNVTSADNTAVGNQCLDAAVSGSNTAMGSRCLTNVTTGSNNTGLGMESGEDLTEGGTNTLIGIQAGQHITTNGANVCLGYRAGATQGNLSQSLWIGRDAGASGNDQIWIYGNSEGACVQGNNATAWSQASDERIKKNIADSTKGLAEIDSLQVRNFEYRTEEEITVDGLSGIYKAGTHVGAIAQEVETVFPEAINVGIGTQKQLKTDPIFWAMVKAVQELSAKNTALEARVKALEDA